MGEYIPYEKVKEFIYWVNRNMKDCKDWEKYFDERRNLLRATIDGGKINDD